MKAYTVLCLGMSLVAVSTKAEEAVQTPQREAVAAGVWKTLIGSPEDLTLLSVAGQQPRKAALAAMPTVAFPLAKAEIEARVNARRTALRFPLGLDKDVYGFGVDFNSLRRTGSVFQPHVDHWGGRTERLGTGEYTQNRDAQSRLLTA